MALVYSKQLLSGSTNGRNIEVDATSSPGTTIHTVQATATTSREEVYLYACNVGTATDTLTIELGGTGTADHVVTNVDPNEGLFLHVPGITFTATTSIVRAYATATGLIHITGYVNRAT
jgi:hypothetical protein